MRGTGNCIVVALAACFGLQLGHAAEERRREAVHRAAELRMREKEPEWKLSFDRALERKVSFEFVGTPIGEAVTFLQVLLKVGVIVDPRAFKGHKPPVEKLNLNVKDMKMRHALRWVLRFAGLDYTFRGRAIFISTPEWLPEEDVVEAYDIRSMISPDLDFPAPRLDLAGRMLPEAPKDAEPEETPEEVALAEMIAERPRPPRWREEFGSTVEERGGMLFVHNKPRVQRNVAGLLRMNGAVHGAQLRVEARVLAVSQALFAKLHAIDEPGMQTVFLREEKLRLLSGALEAGQDAVQLEALSLTCQNGQRTHALAGRALRLAGEAEARFRGTILETRPMLSFDGSYVTTDIELTRIEGGETARVFKLSTTFTCLDTDTVLLAGGALKGGEGARHMIVLVTPRVLGREPEPEARGFRWEWSGHWK